VAPEQVRGEDAWLIAGGIERAMRELEHARARWRKHRGLERERIENGIETDMSRFLRGENTRD